MNTQLPLKRTDHIKFFIGLTIIVFCINVAGYMELKDYEQEKASKEEATQIYKRYVVGK